MVSYIISLFSQGTSGNSKKTTFSCSSSSLEIEAFILDLVPQKDIYTGWCLFWYFFGRKSQNLKFCHSIYQMCHITIIYEYSKRFLTYLSIDKTVMYTSCVIIQKSSYILIYLHHIFHHLFISYICMISSYVNFLPYYLILVDCSCKFSYFVLSQSSFFCLFLFSLKYIFSTIIKMILIQN